ncbi:hypothetical protein MMC34_007145 [Xylographa carneopallida]|nr:hypothetical protein [Xylographa carneopallida]
MKLLLLLLLSAASAWAQNSTHRVTVGANGKLAYNPSTVFANTGDLIQFEFYSSNHSVTQSNPSTPCVPLTTGFFSGFIFEANGSATAATTFVLTVNSTQSLYFYSSQGHECQQGMVGVINPNNSTSQSAYAATAANSSSNSTAPLTGPMGGVLETVATLSNDTTTTLLSTASGTPIPSTASSATPTGVVVTPSGTMTSTLSGGTAAATTSGAATAATTSAAAGKVEGTGWAVGAGMGVGLLGGWAWEW